MRLSEQDIRDDADLFMNDNTPGAITAQVFNDMFVADMADSLIPLDELQVYIAAVCNWDGDLSTMAWETPLYKLTGLSVTLPHNLGSNVDVLIFDENNILQEDSFFSASETDLNTLALTFYRQPDYLKFFKIIIFGV